MVECIGSSRLSTPPDTYLYSLARSANNTLATIGSDDTLRLFTPQLDLLHATPKVHTQVACLIAGSDSAYVTAGREGLLRCWDANGSKVAELADSKGNGFASLACHEHYIAAGNDSTKEGLGDVSVLLYDTRNASAPVRQYKESHTDALTQLSFHPSQPNLLLSGSTDGLVSIFDLNHADEDDALQQVLNPRSAVHCAGFIAEDQAYVVSTDEQYWIYTLAKTAAEDEDVPPPVEFGDVRERLRCMYVIDVLIQPDGPPLMAYGHNEEKTLSIVELGSPGAWDFGRRIDLPGAHGDDVVRGLLVTGYQTFTAGEDGLVKVWSLG